MTPSEKTAREIFKVKGLNRGYPEETLVSDCQIDKDILIPWITDALDAAERRGFERAVRILAMTVPWIERCPSDGLDTQKRLLLKDINDAIRSLTHDEA